jgi:hypothetical protein
VGPESRGTLTGEEWEEWLAGAREDDRFDGAELAAIEREVLSGGSSRDSAAGWASGEADDVPTRAATGA